MRVPKVPSYRNSRTDAVPVPRSKINWRHALGPIGRLLVMALPASGYSAEMAGGAYGAAETSEPKLSLSAAGARNATQRHKI